MNPNPAYYVLVSGKEYGPYEPSDLKAALAENTIESDCLVRAGLSGEWKPVTDVVGSSAPKRIPPKGITAVRRNTFYRPLRVLVTLVALIAVISVCMTSGVATWNAINQRDTIAPLYCVQFLGMILGILAIRGLANVLIDLADTQLSKS